MRYEKDIPFNLSFGEKIIPVLYEIEEISDFFTKNKDKIDKSITYFDLESDDDCGMEKVLYFEEDPEAYDTANYIDPYSDKKHIKIRCHWNSDGACWDSNTGYGGNYTVSLCSYEPVHFKSHWPQYSESEISLSVREFSLSESKDNCNFSIDNNDIKQAYNILIKEIMKLL